MRPAFDLARYERLFNDVWNQLYRLHTTWDIYVCLTGSRHTVELLRSTAIVTFGAFQELLLEAIYLRTHRLLEQAATRGKRRASVEALIQQLPPGSTRLRRELQGRLEGVRRTCASLSDWRDRHVVHRDEPTAVGEHPRPLGRVQARCVSRTIEYVAAALTAISKECGLDRPYRLHEELADSDVHKLIERLRPRNL